MGFGVNIMKVEKGSVVILKRFCKKPVPMKNISSGWEKNSKEFVDTRVFDEYVKIGSSLPKASLSYYNAPKAVRPPSEIFAQPILRAAFEIDMQTASIPWEDMELTLQSSKSTLTRVREIYRAPKYKKSEIETKTVPAHDLEPSSEPSAEPAADISLKSHRSSIREEVKTIFNNEEIKKNTKETPKKRNIRSASFSNIVRRPRPSTSGKVEELMINSLLVKKIQHTRTKTASNNISRYDKLNSSQHKMKFFEMGKVSLAPSNISVQIKKKNIIISESAAFQFNENFSLFSDNSFNAPFAGKMKGNKVQSKFGAMFTPAASLTVTPNHFMNNNF